MGPCGPVGPGGPCREKTETRLLPRSQRRPRGTMGRGHQLSPHAWPSREDVQSKGAGYLQDLGSGPTMSSQAGERALHIILAPTAHPAHGPPRPCFKNKAGHWAPHPFRARTGLESMPGSVPPAPVRPPHTPALAQGAREGGKGSWTAPSSGNAPRTGGRKPQLHGRGHMPPLPGRRRQPRDALGLLSRQMK